MNVSKKTKKAGMVCGTVTVIIVIVLGALASGIFEPGEAKPYFPKEHLFVDAIYLLKTGETNDTVNITCNLYLTNIWEKESGTIKVTAYVIETSKNLAVFKNTVEIGTIGANSTAEIEIPIELSNNSYKVDILIFEDDLLVIKGDLSIRAYPIYYYDAVTHGQSQQWELASSINEFKNVRIR